MDRGTRGRGVTPLRLIWYGVGVGCVVLAGLGVALPLLPTTPFLLLAAYCFARSSPTLHVWLTTHPSFGPAIVDWQKHGAISRRAKRLAATTMLAALLLTLAMGLPGWVIAAQALCLGGAAAFVLSRPDPPA